MDSDDTHEELVDSDDDWSLLRYTFDHYQKYLKEEKDGDRYAVTITDLVYVRNFKKGAAPFGRIQTEELGKKCKELTGLVEPMAKFGDDELRELSESDYDELKDYAKGVVEYDEIEGFKVARLSGLLHCLFPKLFPIIDVNVQISLFGDAETSPSATRYIKVLKRARSDPGIQSVEEFDKYHWCEGKRIGDAPCPNGCKDSKKKAKTYRKCCGVKKD